MLRLAFDFIIAWREIRARPNAYREKILPRPWEGKDSDTFVQLYRHTNQTIQAYLLNCTGILMQLHQNLETIIPRCPHNYIGILIMI